MQRRQFLLAAPAGVVAACGGGAETGGPAGDRADLALLQPALELEYSSAALYAAGVDLARGRRAEVRRILEHERAHAEGLRQAILDLRGVPARPRPVAEYTAAFPPLRDERAFVAFAREFEQRAVEAYAAALLKVRSPRLRAMAASLLAAEAEHASVLADNPLERVLEL